VQPLAEMDAVHVWQIEIQEHWVIHDRGRYCYRRVGWLIAAFGCRLGRHERGGWTMVIGTLTQISASVKKWSGKKGRVLATSRNIVTEYL
jgi:hypothetical protein